MQVSELEQITLWLSTIGLALGVGGAIGLALLTKVFITINPDGTQHWGPGDMPNDQWLRRNIRLRKIQKYGIPLSYFGVALGFFVQLISLWLPEVLGSL